MAEGAAAAILLGTSSVAQAACSGQSSSGLQDPLKFCTITGFVEGVLQAFVMISLPILSFLIVWAGFKFVMAQGKPTELANAKTNFKWLLAGAILILSAWALAALIANTINQVAGGQ
jgi:hypothetical protein